MHTTNAETNKTTNKQTNICNAVEVPRKGAEICRGIKVVFSKISEGFLAHKGPKQYGYTGKINKNQWF